MKRLLTYLIIILGLGLTFSVNSYSAVYCVDDKIDERIANFKPNYPKRENEFFYFSEQSGACIGSYTQVTYEQYNYFKNLFSREKLKIAKTEPSQTQSINVKEKLVNLKVSGKTDERFLCIKQGDYVTTNFALYKFYHDIADQYKQNCEFRIYENIDKRWWGLFHDVPTIEKDKFYKIVGNDLNTLKTSELFLCAKETKYVKTRFILNLERENNNKNLNCDHKIFEKRDLEAYLKLYKKDLIDKVDFYKIVENNKIKIAKVDQRKNLKENLINEYKYNLQNTKTIPFLKISLNENIKNYNLDIPENNKVKYRQGDVTSYYIYNRQFDTNKTIFDDEYLKFSSISKDYTVPYQAIIISTDKKGKIYSISGFLYYKKFEDNSFNKSEIENCDKYREPFISRNEIKLTANDLTSAYVYIEDIKNNNYYYKNALRKSVISDFSSTFGITCNYTIKPNKGETISDIRVSTMTADKQLEYWENNKGILISKFTGDDLINLTKNKDNKFSSYYDYLNYDYGFLSTKKTKTAKAEEPKQEEFKPEDKDIDKDAPIIEIAKNFTVDSQTYTLKGKVKDKSKFYLEANGRPIELNDNGNFKLEGFIVDPEAGEEIKIVAIDRWNNQSEKIVNVKVEFKEVTDVRTYEQPNPGKIRVKQDKDKIALIIGIEKYKNLVNKDAPYANRDANAFRAYANRALGIPNKNIKVLIDEEATRGETLKALTLWLPQVARGKGKDIFVFFAGHGLASDDGKNLYLLPQDGDEVLLQYTALSRLEIFDLINKVEPNSVTMFFDTCYSGQTRDEEMLVAGLRPIRLVAEEQDVQNNFTIFSASNYNQTSGSIEEAKHGIFSYYLMRGMEGNADSNNDKKITNGELIAYLKENVSEEAFINNREQEPMLSGDPDKVLISYR